MPSLEWIGKKAVVNHHRDVPYRLIHCDKKHSSGDPDAGNLLVQGDNLEALKALLPYYAGRVKCVYIDPPFNTGSEDWIYNDNVTSPEIASWIGTVVGEEAVDLTRHDKWLCMLYPRLKLLREFLSPDGTIFIHIDDNELSYLISIADEIFGRKNRCFVISFKQASATGHKAINPGCVSVTNYVVIYSRDKSSWKPNRVFTGRERDKRYGQFIPNIDDPFTEWRFISLTQGFADKHGLTPRDARKLQKDNPDKLDQFVLDHAKQVVQLARPDYESVGAETRDAIDISEREPAKIVRVARTDFSDIFLKGGQRVLFYSDKVKIINGQPVAGEPLTTLWDDILSNNIHQEGGVEFPKGKKPEALISRCLELATSPHDLVLDSFSGSGTTAAVAHKMVRRWIAIESGEHAVTHSYPRLKRVVDGADPSGVTAQFDWKGGGGFRFCKLGSPLFDADGNISIDVKFEDLAAHIFFCETGSPLPKKANSKTPLLGTFEDRAVYLLFAFAHMGYPNANAGNVLNVGALEALPVPKNFTGHKVVYAEGCTVSPDRLGNAGVVFKQVPYQIEGL